MSRIVHLNLTKKWFGLIKKQTKKTEYREFKKHWQSRFIKDGELIHDGIIRFANGYGANVPFLEIEFSSIEIVDGSVHETLNGEILDDSKFYFAISLGRILTNG